VAQSSALRATIAHGWPSPAFTRIATRAGYPGGKTVASPWSRNPVPCAADWAIDKRIKESEQSLSGLNIWRRKHTISASSKMQERRVARELQSSPPEPPHCRDIAMGCSGSTLFMRPSG